MGQGSGILVGHMVLGQVMLSWGTAGPKTTRQGGQFKIKFTNLATCTKQVLSSERGLGTRLPSKMKINVAIYLELSTMDQRDDSLST